jgi:hypothetical protein
MYRRKAMKKTLVLLVALGLIAGSFAAPATAKKKKKKKPVRVERVVEARYEFPAGIGSSSIGGACSGCPAFPNSPDELYVAVEVTDDASPTAGVSFSWDTDGDGVSDTGFEVCGATDGFIEIPSSVSITAFPWILPGADCPDGVSTSGTIKVTFSNMP